MAREQWKSQFGFLLAAVGSAIGLGNIWRFSYMAYDNGGGAFLIPYLVALFTAGIPLLILEFAIGHERIGSAPLALHKIRPRWEWLGWWAVIFVMFGIELYYTVVISWCANFFVYSFDLAWGDNTSIFFFKDFLGAAREVADGGPSGWRTPFEIGQIRTPIFIGLAAVWFLNWIITYRGVQQGIELANKIFMPLLFALTAVLVFWALTLEGARNGISAYLTPDFSKLTKPKVWLDAYGQIFFTLSLGFGIMIAYASYLPEKSNITKSAFLTAFINCGYSLFAGFAVFSVLGFMAQAQGVPVTEVVKGGPGLAFVVYPKAVSLMPGGHIFGAIFFLCLVVAGMSSSISIVEAFTSAVVDKFGFDRKKVVNAVSIVGFLGATIFATESGLFWLDIVDHFLNYYGLIMVGVLECIVVAWLFRLDIIKSHVNKVSSIQLGLWWDVLVKFFVPLVLGGMLIWNLVEEVQKPYEGYSWTALILIGRDWILFTLIAAFWFALRPWRTEHHKGESRGEAVPEVPETVENSDVGG